jgi:hypothetical protein
MGEAGQDCLVGLGDKLERAARDIHQSRMQIALNLGANETSKEMMM